MDLKIESPRVVGQPAFVGPCVARPRARAAAPAAMLCAVTLIGLGCASTTAAEGSPRRGVVEPASAPARRALVAEPSSVELSPYNDTAPAMPATTPAAADGRGDGLVGALAASYETDMKALAEMQFRRAAAKPSLSAGAAARDVPLPELAPVRPPAATPTPAPSTSPSTNSSPNPSPALPPTPSTTPSTTPSPTPSTAPSTTPSITPSPTSAPVGSDAASTAGPSAAPAASAALPVAQPTEPPATTAPSAEQSSTLQSSSAPAAAPSSTQANAPLELPPAVPTDSKSLARLLADSLVRESGESVTPLGPWLGYAALAITDPSIELPKDFGADLLPAERERVTKARAAFAALGKALRDGRGEVDRATVEQLAAALSGGPRLAIPKVELCTRVEGFGRFDAIAMKRFPARRNTRFIAYTELEGFTSALEQGRFTTRLATRIAIEAQSDGTEVWNRSPEWTAVVDASDVRRSDFFVGEIVPLSESLSVGGYLLKVTVRDEGTGATATSSIPFQIVADSGLATVPAP
ncbi:MAG: hypothetical protein ACKOYN_05990 [Planctomycetota bacterium]